MIRTPAGAANAQATIEYEPPLVEEAVRFALEHRPPDLHLARAARLRYENLRRLEELYALPRDEDRESAFRQHFSNLFRTLRLDRAPAGWLETFPRLGTDLECILVRSARGRADEGAELWESRDQRGSGVPSYLVIAVRPRALSHPEELRDRVLPSLQRAADRVASVREADCQSSPSSQPPAAAPESHCPLCRFPTIAWALPEVLPEIAASIEADFPAWTSIDRCCSHCAERYQSLAAPASAPSPY